MGIVKIYDLGALPPTPRFITSVFQGKDKEKRHSHTSIAASPNPYVDRVAPLCCPILHMSKSNISVPRIMDGYSIYTVIDTLPYAKGNGFIGIHQGFIRKSRPIGKSIFYSDSSLGKMLFIL